MRIFHISNGMSPEEASVVSKYSKYDGIIDKGDLIVQRFRNGECLGHLARSFSMNIVDLYDFLVFFMGKNEYNKVAEMRVKEAVDHCLLLNSIWKLHFVQKKGIEEVADIVKIPIERVQDIVSKMNPDEWKSYNELSSFP